MPWMPSARCGRVSNTRSFNSATTPMPWMRRPEGCHRPRRDCFNSATTPMPWMPIQSNGTPHMVGCFNSATTPMPWMREGVHCRASGRSPASIRPRQCRGCHPTDLEVPPTISWTPMPWMPGCPTWWTTGASIRPRRKLVDSNGRPASIRPRHQCRGCPAARLAGTSPEWLQFGHDTNAVDAPNGRDSCSPCRCASIRPRHQCRGCCRLA